MRKGLGGRRGKNLKMSKNKSCHWSIDICYCSFFQPPCCWDIQVTGFHRKTCKELQRWFQTAVCRLPAPGLQLYSKREKFIFSVCPMNKHLFIWAGCEDFHFISHWLEQMLGSWVSLFLLLLCHSLTLWLWATWKSVIILICLSIKQTSIYLSLRGTVKFGKCFHCNKRANVSLWLQTFQHALLKWQSLNCLIRWVFWKTNVRKIPHSKSPIMMKRGIKLITEFPGSVQGALLYLSVCQGY